MHLFTGSNGLSANTTYDMLDDTEYDQGFDWETMAETLQDANVTWRVLQEVTLDVCI
jgi:phospholipase C